MPEFSDKPGYAFDPGPPPEASRFLANKGLRPSFSFRDVEPEEHAVAFTVAKAMQTDVLGDIRAEVQAALDEGLPYREFEKRLRPKLAERGWWGRGEMTDPKTGEVREVQLGSPRRLRTIYRANLRSARAAGQWERIQRTQDALPYLQYNLGPSERHREHHVDKAGLVLPADDPFWTRWMPPNGWGCKCWVRQVSGREAGRLGVDTAPEVPVRTVRNTRTGEVREVPEGLDPAWDRNPGMLRQEAMTRMLYGKLEAADPAVARVVTRDIAESWMVRRMIEEGRAAARQARQPDPRFVPISLLPERAIDPLSAQRRGVILSGETARKQAKNHPELTQEDYERLELLLADGEMRRAGRNALAFVERGTETPWLAVVKALPSGENFLQSLYRVGAARYFRRRILQMEKVGE